MALESPTHLSNDELIAADPVATMMAHDDEHLLHAVVPPIVQTSLFTFPDFASMAARFRGETTRPVYSRGDNPTVTAFEAKIAALENADAARGFASGMGAISNAILAFVEAGDRIVCVRHVYPDTYRLMTGLLPRLGVSVDFVDGLDHAAMARAMRGAKLLYLESPTSWTFEIHDLAALAAMARDAGTVSVIDNSCASPYFQRPLDLGVDLVLHSASKYISGHSDVVAGVVAGSARMIGLLDERVRPYLGAKLAPLDAFLLLRGLRTLPLRMRQHHASGREIARRLNAHPAVARVYHPEIEGPLPSWQQGHSGLFAFEAGPGIDLERFCNRLELFHLGVSWGGFESLICPAIMSLQQANGANSTRDFGVSERMIRLHVGLEDVEDLWRDLDRAFRAATQS